ncbi:hypothetical protein BDW59DRAFT_110093 [Aspergillus cavernicola]|uniref:IBR domain-containing protein n=1 Tax=Aspergillus cavernicola TaxID=176166 RepID=A0ABR4I1Z8_9EURO
MHLEDSISGLNRMSLIIAQRASANTETNAPDRARNKQPSHQLSLQPIRQPISQQLQQLLDRSSRQSHSRASYEGGGGGGLEISMWICCNCGDGPKVSHHETVCIACHHISCSTCRYVK